MRGKDRPVEGRGRGWPGVDSRLLELVLISALLACGSDQRANQSEAGLVLLVDTDLSLPQDFDRIVVVATQGQKELFRVDQLVGPNHLHLPAEFLIKATGDSTPVTARGVAYKNGEARIERSAVTPFPTSFIGQVRLPLVYLCDGTANADGKSTCGDERTCKQGTCRTSEEVVMPRPEAPGPTVDAGGTVTPQAMGDCFDVLACFAGSSEVEIEAVSCTVALPAGANTDRLNFAIRRPAGSAGICNAEGCWIPLDRGGEGWTVAGPRIQLPPGLCAPRPDGRKLVVVISDRCGAKTSAYPPCGAWSKMMAIESPPPPSMVGGACTPPGSRNCGNCGTQSRQCQNGTWSSWGPCTGEGICATGTSQACGRGGTQLCGGTCAWGTCAGQTCDGPPTRSCGNCGTQSRTCNNGVWSDWSECEGGGVCAPNTVRSCDTNGTQSCGGNCHWSPCQERLCPGPDVRSCGNCGTQSRTCDPATTTWSDWSPCAGEGECAPNTTTLCSQGGGRTCGGNCRWSACMGLPCSGPAGEVCARCGTRTRTCNSNTGQWGEWSLCENQGSCTAGDEQVCGMDGMQSCAMNCQWEACKNQRCEGPEMQECGKCGKQTRTCANGVWSAWSECTDQGECAVGSSETCGSGGQRSCSAACKWEDCFEACAINRGGCDPLTSCTNTGTTRICGPCPAGYFGTGATGCFDINECAVGNGGCDLLTSCINFGGGFTCGTCPLGYANLGTPTSTMCVDINECSTNNGGCDPLTSCTNTPGGFTCGDCPPGHTTVGGACVDIDECSTGNGGCDPLTSCTNTPGSRTCGMCPSGYLGTGATGCTDIDECDDMNGHCDLLTTCMNLPGGSLCGPCPMGYMGTGSTTCTDVDECATSNGGCSVNATCTNTPGSRDCACHPGYDGDGLSCADEDECATGNGGCSVNATCTNTPGSRTCACLPGYAGDGLTCVNDDPGLTALVLSSGALVPAFATGTTNYSATVNVSSITVTPTALQPAGVTITVNSTVVASGSASPPLPLIVGANTVTVTSTAVGGMARTYTVVVTRSGGGNQTVAGSATATPGSSTWIRVTAPFTGDQNGNGYTLFEVGGTAMGPFHNQNSYAGRPGSAEWRQTRLHSLTPGATYFVRVTYFDPDGVAGNNTQIIGPVVMPSGGSPAVSVGPMNAQVLEDEIYVSTPISDDSNGNAVALVDYATSESGPWTRACGNQSSVYAPMRCRVRSLQPGTNYWVRMTVSDSNGVVGSAVQTAGPLHYSGPRNLARNAVITADTGWGCCPSPAQLVDGRIQAEDFVNGFGWAGGTGNWGGGGPGLKQATLDLGQATPFSRVVIWFHDPQNVPTTWKIQYSAEGMTWTDAFTTTTPSCRTATAQMPAAWFDPACAHQAVFPAVTARFVRYVFDDTTLFNGTHGWAAEIEVY